MHAPVIGILSYVRVFWYFLNDSSGCENRLSNLRCCNSCTFTSLFWMGVRCRKMNISERCWRDFLRKSKLCLLRYLAATSECEINEWGACHGFLIASCVAFSLSRLIAASVKLAGIRCGSILQSPDTKCQLKFSARTRRIWSLEWQEFWLKPGQARCRKADEQTATPLVVGII